MKRSLLSALHDWEERLLLHVIYENRWQKPELKPVVYKNTLHWLSFWNTSPFDFFFFLTWSNRALILNNKSKLQDSNNKFTSSGLENTYKPFPYMHLIYLCTSVWMYVHQNFWGIMCKKIECWHYSLCLKKEKKNRKWKNYKKHKK